jgi:hypothetical protein
LVTIVRAVASCSSDYLCAWQRDFLVQGRLYLSSRSIYFHSNILSWKTSLVLHWDDVIGITREKTVKVIANAIELRARRDEKYFFTSFTGRDKTYELMVTLWQSAVNGHVGGRDAPSSPSPHIRVDVVGEVGHAHSREQRQRPGLGPGLGLGCRTVEVEAIERERAAGRCSSLFVCPIDSQFGV